MAADAEEFHRSMEEALDALRQVRANPADPDTAVRGEGEAAHGLIRAVALSGGRIEAVTVDPRAMRLASQDLAEGVTAAVNAALDDLRGKTADRLTDNGLDPAALLDRLQEVQVASAERMQAFLRTIGDASSRVAQSPSPGRSS